MNNRYATRRLLVLGGGPMQVEAYSVARSLGLRTVGVDPSVEAPCAKLADRFYAADLADLPALKRIADDEAVDGVVTLAADYPMPALGQLCADLRLSGPSADTVATTCNKARLRRATASKLSGSPQWQEFATLEEAARCVLLEQSRCIVKPADSSGGRGVTQLVPGAAAQTIRSAMEVAFTASKGRRILVEEFVDGPEYSVESVTFQGTTTTVAVTEKSTSGPPFYFETGHVVPAELPAGRFNQISAFAAKVAGAIAIDNCATHLELKLTAGGPVLIEIAARLGGGFINTDLVPLATGVNIVKAAIDIALGIRPEVAPRENAAAAVRFLIPPPGTLRSIGGIEGVASRPEICRIVCDYKSGDVIPITRDATGRKAYLICKGRTPQEVTLHAQSAADAVEFRMHNDG